VTIARGAVFDAAGVYRYHLWRRWSDHGPRVVFVGLNPSTADGSHDDPTIRRCMGFAERWGCAHLDVLNLFAFRATRPRDLRQSADPVGPDNPHYLESITKGADTLVACWGVHGAWQDQGVQLRELLPGPWFCLGLTQAGHPRHPLYLRKGTPLQSY
jgi:hypothetical protein